jgi:hypothetical protein
MRLSTGWRCSPGPGAIVDVLVPPMFTAEGLVAATDARDRRPGMPVLVLRQYVEQMYARELMLSRRAGRRLPPEGPPLAPPADRC